MSKDYNTVAAEIGQRLMHTFDDITNHDAAECDLMRDNANINADTAMGAMLQIGANTAMKS